MSMWHQCTSSFANCYANSTDGIHWTRPDLGLVTGAGADPSTVLTRTDSTSQRDSVCTAVKTLGTATHHTCRDTQPSVVHTPHLAGAEYQMFNFNYGQDVDSKCPHNGQACDKDGYCALQFAATRACFSLSSQRLALTA